MAHFRGIIKGNRGESSRLGSKNSGISAQINGWNTGVDVWGVCSDEGGDRFEIRATGGSNGGQERKLIGVITSVNGELVIATKAG